MKARVLSFLQEHPVATLATLSPSYTPQTATVYAYVDSEFNAFCLTKTTTKKYKNVEDRRSVALSFFDENSLLACEIEGVGYALTAGEDVMAAITQLQEVLASRREGYWIPPVSQLDGSQYVIIKVFPMHIVFSNYGETASSVEHQRPQRVSVDLG